MIFSNTACADRRAKRFYGAIIGLLFAAVGCSVTPNEEKPAPLPAASVDPNAALGSTATVPTLRSEGAEAQTGTTPTDSP
jgi:hypothetical protein